MFSGYDDAKKRLAERIAYWKKIGYSCKIEQNNSLLSINFSNNHERIPCYVDIGRGHIVCSGDYGDFIFDEDWQGLDNVPVGSINYLFSKLGTNNAEEFSYDVFKKDCEELKKDCMVDIDSEFPGTTKEDDDSDWDEISEPTTRKQAIQRLNSAMDDLEEADGSGNDAAQKIDDFFEKMEMDDPFERYDMGITYSEHALAQIAIIKFAQDELEKQKGGTK